VLSSTLTGIELQLRGEYLVHKARRRGDAYSTVAYLWYPMHELYRDGRDGPIQSRLGDMQHTATISIRIWYAHDRRSDSLGSRNTSLSRVGSKCAFEAGHDKCRQRGIFRQDMA
jgi:hypothetical protein